MTYFWFAMAGIFTALAFPDLPFWRSVFLIVAVSCIAWGVNA